MGVLGNLMGSPIKYPRTPIKYPKTPEAGGRHIGGVWGGGVPQQNMFVFIKSPSGNLKTNTVGGVRGGATHSNVWF